MRAVDGHGARRPWRRSHHGLPRRHRCDVERRALHHAAPAGGNACPGGVRRPRALRRADLGSGRRARSFRRNPRLSWGGPGRRGDLRRDASPCCQRYSGRHRAHGELGRKPFDGRRLPGPRALPRSATRASQRPRGDSRRHRAGELRGRGPRRAGLGSKELDAYLALYAGEHATGANACERMPP